MTHECVHTYVATCAASELCAAWWLHKPTAKQRRELFEGGGGVDKRASVAVKKGGCQPGAVTIASKAQPGHMVARGSGGEGQKGGGGGG